MLKDGKTAADIYPPKGAKEVKPAVKPVEEDKPVEEVKAAVEEVKVEEKPAEEVKVVEEVKPVVEEEKPVEEEKAAEEAAPESTSVWTSISNTFWWLLGYKN